MKQRFKIRLVGRGPRGAWAFLPIPFDVEREFGSRARVAVAGTINNHPFRSSIMPEGDGTHSMMVNKALKGGARASVGDLVTVVMDVDRAERKVEVPRELGSALRREPRAKKFFEQLSYSYRKEYADWIAGAKRPETKSARVGKSVELLLDGKKLR
jgi:bacteriocin resistance YdeI/OmpD-like protein/uncharacterized protein DUF1905